MKKALLIACSYCLTLGIVSQANAKSLIDPAYGTWALGINNTTNNYTNNNNKTRLTPLIFGGYGAVAIDGNRASYTFYKDGTYYASTVAQLRSHQARQKNDIPVFSALGDRTNAIEAGFSIGRRLPNGFGTNIAFLTDVSGAHNGQEIDWQLFRHDQFSNISLLTTIGLQFQSDKLANYYFATNTYKPNQSNSFELEFIATYPLKNWDIFVGTRNYFYDDNINDSPLTKNNLNSQFFAGVGWRFK